MFLGIGSVSYCVPEAIGGRGWPNPSENGTKPQRSAKRRTTRPPRISLHQARRISILSTTDRTTTTTTILPSDIPQNTQPRCGTFTPRKRCQSPTMVSIRRSPFASEALRKREPGGRWRPGVQQPCSGATRSKLYELAMAI